MALPPLPLIIKGASWGCTGKLRVGAPFWTEVGLHFAHAKKSLIPNGMRAIYLVGLGLRLFAAALGARLARTRTLSSLDTHNSNAGMASPPNHAALSFPPGGGEWVWIYSKTSVLGITPPPPSTFGGPSLPQVIKLEKHNMTETEGQS